MALKTIAALFLLVSSPLAQAGYRLQVDPMSITLLTKDGAPMAGHDVRTEFTWYVYARGNVMGRSRWDWFYKTSSKSYRSDASGVVRIPEIDKRSWSPREKDMWMRLVISPTYPVECRDKTYRLNSDDMRNLALGGAKYSVADFFNFQTVQGKTHSGRCYHHVKKPHTGESEFSPKLVCRSASVTSRMLESMKESIIRNKREICQRLAHPRSRLNDL